MEQIKATRILSKLDATEISWLAQALEKEGKPKRLKLFKLLKQEGITRSILFKKLFAATYSKEKDYLLRNELFKLTEWLEHTLIKKTHCEALQNDKWLQMSLQMHLYGRLKLSEEADHIYNELQKQMEGANMYTKALNNLFEYIPYVIAGTVQHKARAAKLKPMIEQGLSYFYKSSAIEYQQLRSSESFLKHFNTQAGLPAGEICEDASTLVIDVKLHKTNLSEFYNLYANCFSNLGAAQLKMEDLLAAQQAILPLVSLDAKYKNYYINILQMTAVQYSVNGNFENADEYFRRGLDIVPRTSDMFQSFLMNHTTNLIKLKKYAEAADTLERESAFLIQRLPIIATLINQRLIACYIYLKQPDKLYKILNTDFNLLEPYLQVYYRLSYCVLLLIKKEYEAACREITNINRSKLSAGVEPGYALIIDFFNEAIRHVNNHQTISRLPKSTIQKIKPFADSVDALQFTNYTHIMPYVWLKEAVGM